MIRKIYWKQKIKFTGIIKFMNNCKHKIKAKYLIQGAIFNIIWKVVGWISLRFTFKFFGLASNL